MQHCLGGRELVHMYLVSYRQHRLKTDGQAQSSQAHFRVISPSGQIEPIRREGRGCDVIIVPLLLQDVALTPPLPHQQLPQSSTPQCYPVPSLVEGDGIDC